MSAVRLKNSAALADTYCCTAVGSTISASLVNCVYRQIVPSLDDRHPAHPNPVLVLYLGAIQGMKYCTYGGENQPTVFSILEK